MSSGARHAVGAVVGLVVTPMLLLCLAYASERAVRVSRFFIDPPWSDRLILLALLVAAGLLLGLVLGSWTSPLASAVPGAIFLLLGLAWIVAQRFMFTDLTDLVPTQTLRRGFVNIGAGGILLFTGVALLVASASPARWRQGTRTASAPSRQAFPPAPGGPGGHGGPGAPGAPVPPGYGAQPMHPGQYPPAPGQYGQPARPPAAPSAAPPAAGPGQPPPYAPPPAAPPAAAPPPPGPPASSGRPESSRRDEDDDDIGEWTQMYGGKDRRDNG